MARNRQRAKARRAKRESLGIPNPANERAEEPVGPSNGAKGAPSKTDAVAAATAASAKSAETTTAEQPKSKAKSAKAAPPAEPRQKGRFRAFLRSSWAELRRVQWPDRRQVSTLTGIVIGFVVLAGAYLGIIDVAASELVDLII